MLSEVEFISRILTTNYYVIDSERIRLLRVVYKNYSAGRTWIQPLDDFPLFKLPEHRYELIKFTKGIYSIFSDEYLTPEDYDGIIPDSWLWRIWCAYYDYIAPISSVSDPDSQYISPTAGICYLPKVNSDQIPNHERVFRSRMFHDDFGRPRLYTNTIMREFKNQIFELSTVISKYIPDLGVYPYNAQRALQILSHPLCKSMMNDHITGSPGEVREIGDLLTYDAILYYFSSWDPISCYIMIKVLSMNVDFHHIDNPRAFIINSFMHDCVNESDLVLSYWKFMICPLTLFRVDGVLTSRLMNCPHPSAVHAAADHIIKLTTPLITTHNPLQFTAPRLPGLDMHSVLIGMDHKQRYTNDFLSTNPEFLPEERYFINIPQRQKVYNRKNLRYLTKPPALQV